MSPVPPSFRCNLSLETACICLQRASCYSPATCQLQLLLSTCSRCMHCKKAVVWYNSVLGPLPSLLALICSCRCAFCKDVIPLTAYKNSTRHFNMNTGMPLQTRYPHDLNSEFFVSVYYHTACSYPGCKQDDIINCEAAIRDHKRFMKWQDMKRSRHMSFICQSVKIQPITTMYIRALSLDARLIFTSSQVSKTPSPPCQLHLRLDLRSYMFLRVTPLHSIQQD